MSSEPVIENGDEQQIPPEDITAEEPEPQQDVNDESGIEEQVDQCNEDVPAEVDDGGDENMDTTQPDSAPSPGGGDSTQSDTFAGEEIPYDPRKIFVGGLSNETNEESLRKYFEQYGTVTDIKLKMDQETRKSRGFAFVMFAEVDAAQKILGECESEGGAHVIDGKKVDTKKAIPHAIHQALKNRTKKIFVGGVPTDMPEETINSYFIQFGEIEEVALVTDKGTKKRRGFVFVTFSSEDSVDKCTDKTFHQIGEFQVEVKRATPREQTAPGRGGHGFRGGNRGGGMRGGYRGGFVPYGHFGGYGGGGGGYYHGGYGGYGGGYGFQPPYGGGFHPYGGPGAYEGGFYSEGPRGGAQGGYGSRYGPMKGGYNHGGGSSYHPYSR